MTCDGPDDHTWWTMRGGREKCSTCGTVFPCRAKCGHLDCKAERGEADEQIVVSLDALLGATCQN
jgi:hypothetical protein